MATTVESRYYVKRTVLESKDNLKNKAKGYNEKYFKPSIATSREFLTGFTSDPRKKMDTLFRDTNKHINNFKTISNKRYNGFVVDGKVLFGKLKESPLKTMETIFGDTKEDTLKKVDEYKQTGSNIFKCLKNDVYLALDDVTVAGKKVLNNAQPIKKTISTKFNSGIKSLPNKLNLPGKKELDVLMNGITDVNEKLKTLTKRT